MDRCAARRLPGAPPAVSFVAQLAQDARVVGPGLAYFDPGAQVHLAAEQLFHVLARRGRHALQALAAGAEHDRLLAVAFHQDGGLDAPKLALLLEAVDDDFAAVRQLGPHLLEQLLAQQLRGEEALVAVGELVRRVGRRRLGQRLAQRFEQLRDVPAGLGAYRHDGGELARLRQALEERQQLRAVLHHVDLVDRRDDTLRGRDLVQHRLVVRPEAQRFHHEERDIGVARGLGGAAVEAAVQRVAGLCLLPGRVDEHVLALRRGQDAGDQVARGLRLGRDDGDLLAHHPVEQAGFAGVRAAGEADGAAAVRAHAWSLASISRAASCSARWREVPVPWVRASPTAHSTSNERACGAPWVATTRYCGGSWPRAWSSSCRLVLGSFSTRAGSSCSSRGPSACTTARRAAAYPPSRKIAPITASSASARTDGGTGGAPARTRSARPSSRARRASDSSRTRLARSWVSLPSGRCGKRV